MTEAHSKYSASGFEAAALCPGKPVMERGKPDSSSEYADEGTAAHKLLDWCLKQDKDAAAFKGRRIAVGLRTFEVDDYMAGYVQTVVNNTRDALGDGMLLSDQKVVYGPALGLTEDEAWGTLDTIGVRGTELQVRDFKYGRGVEVFAERNPQMMLYALGALAAVGDVLGPFETVRLFIDQPRIKDAPSEWSCTVEDLLAWAAGPGMNAVMERQAAEAVRAVKDEQTWEQQYLAPGEKQCKFCRAKATCPALRGVAISTITNAPPPADIDEFDDLPVPGRKHIEPADDGWLAAAMRKADLIEDWIKAVRAEVERRLLAGNAVPGFKLVEGRLGNRAWSDAAAAEAAFKGMRLKVEQMYDLTLISPTGAEKLAKAKVIGPRQWKGLQELIKRADGKKHVAPDSDSRPAIDIRPVIEDFDNVPDEPTIA